MKNTNFDRVVTDLKNLIQETLEQGKAENVVTVDLDGKSDIADYMIIASGTSGKHSVFLAEKLTQQIKENDPLAVSYVEGLEDGSWVLVDVGDIVVHIFKPGVREIYNLEKMWSVKMPEQEAELAAN